MRSLSAAFPWRLPRATWMAVGFAFFVIVAFTRHPLAGFLAILAPVAGLVLLPYSTRIWQWMMFFFLFASSYLPTSLGGIISWSLLLLFASSVWMAKVTERRAMEWGDFRVWICLAGFLFWALLCTLRSISPVTSMKELIRYGFSFFIFLTYLNWFRSEDQLKTVMRWCERLAIFVASVCVLEGMMWFLRGVEVQPMVNEPVAWIKGPYPPTFSEMGAIIAAMFPVSFALLLHSSMKRSLPRLIGLMVMLAGVFLSTSRASLMAAVVGAGIVFFMMSSRRLKFFLSVLLISAVIFLLAFLNHRYGDLQTGLVHNLSGRNLLWNAAIQAVTEQPVFGIGPGCWSVWLPQHFFTVDFVMGDLKGNFFALNPGMLGGEAHNLFFTKAAEMGYPALAWLAMFVLSWAAAALASLHALPWNWYRVIGTGCFAAFFGLLFRCLFENGPVIGRGRGMEVVLVWILAATPLLLKKINQGGMHS